LVTKRYKILAVYLDNGQHDYRLTAPCLKLGYRKKAGYLECEGSELFILYGSIGIMKYCLKISNDASQLAFLVASYYAVNIRKNRVIHDW